MTKNRIEHTIKQGGNLGTDGLVSYMFNKKGIICFDTS